MYRVGFRGANLLKMSLVTTAAMLAVCLLALVGTTSMVGATSLPHNGRIAFISNSSNSSNSIYTADPDGSNLRQLTNSTSGASLPRWSPDGTEIAFSHQGSSGADISVMNADGSTLRDLDASGTWSSGPTWSPDGTKLAFASSVPPYNYQDIYVTEPDGSNQINLTKSTGLDESSPDFSPDGSQMCFSQYNPNASKPAPGMYVMGTDGSDPTLLVQTEPGTVMRCDWSPDGTKIAFSTVHFSDTVGAVYRKAIKKAVAEGDMQKAVEAGISWGP